tara:strand:- start:47 stop:253 length:207 start_codon:yes stop_codon:yes gene_type:complete
MADNNEQETQALTDSASRPSRKSKNLYLDATVVKEATIIAEQGSDRSISSMAERLLRDEIAKHKGDIA